MEEGRGWLLRKHKFNLQCGEQGSRTQTHPNNQPVITGHYSSSSSRYITAVLTDACVCVGGGGGRKNPKYNRKEATYQGAEIKSGNNKTSTQVPPFQPRNVDMSCWIKLQPVSLDVRLEPKAVDEAQTRISMCVCARYHAQRLHLRPLIG